MKGLMALLMLCYSAMHINITAASNDQQIDNKSYSKSAIVNDIKALSGPDKAAREAINRLTTSGSVVLEPLHEALSDKEVSIKHKQTIVLIIGIVADSKSIQSLIQVAKNHPDELNLNKAVIRALSNYPRSKDIDEFVYGYLDGNDVDSGVLRTALDFLTKDPVTSDKKWAEIYSAKGYDLKIRSTAFYLGGLLNIDTFKDKIMDTLLHRNKKTGEEYMLIALSNLTQPEEFNALVKIEGIHLNSDHISSARYNYYLKNGTVDQQKEAASIIVQKGPRLLKKDAIEYFMHCNDAEGLANAWMRNDRLVKHMVIRSGLIIDIDENGAKFKKLTNIDEASSDSLAGTSESSRDELSKSIFSSFQTNNKQKFKSSAIPNKREINRHLAALSPAHTYKTGMLKGYKDQLGKNIESIMAAWDVIYAKGIDNNIDWSASKYVASKQYHQGSNGWEFLFTHKGHYYRIQLPDLTQYEGVWKLSSALRWSNNAMRSRDYMMWRDIAEKNNETIAVRELKLLSNTSKEGLIPILRMRAEYESVVDQYKLYSSLEVSANQEDKDEALIWLSRAASNNYAIAQFELSEHLMSIWYETQAIETLHDARNNLLKSTQQNYIFALNRIAGHYARGGAGFDLDFDKAIEYYQRLLDLDVASLNKDDQNAYKFLRAGVLDKIAALQTQQKGLKDKDPKILTELALMQLKNRTIISKNNGLNMLKVAAEAKYPEAQYQLGKIYISGNDVERKNIQAAVDLWEQAVTQNHIDATRDLAYGFINGKHDIEKNPKKAIDLADKLATYYQNNAEEHKFSDSVQIWRVHACNLDIEIKRNNDPAFVIPRVKTGRCAGL